MLIGCIGNNSATKPEYSITIDLDSFPATEIILVDEYRVTLIGEDDLLSSPWYITVTDEVIFLNDTQATPLRIIDKKTHEVVRSYGKGSGPGEFNWISGISANKRHVVVADMGSKMNSYFDHLGRMDTMAVTTANYNFGFLSFFSINDSLFTSGSSNPDYLIQLNSLYRESEPMFFKDRIIPHGHQPGIYNWPMMTLSEHFLAYSITGIPEITFADFTGQNLFSISVTSEEIRKIENPPVLPVLTDVPMRVSSVISVLRLIGNRLYIFSTGGILTIIEIDIDDPAGYYVVGRYRFMKKDEHGQINLFGLFSDLDYDGKDLYFTHAHSSSLYRIPFTHLLDH